jgi:cytochrome c oxidase cbb3-type subunit 3
MGGPNLLRSQLALSDREGELIVPIIQGSEKTPRMPPMQMKPDDAKAVAAYVRSVLETIGRQGMPPSIGQAAPSILVGNAKEGEAYFGAKCTGCHSATGDLRGVATKYADPKMLQNTWVSGGRRGRGPARPGGPVITAVITPTTGSPVEGRLVRIDDFFVSVELADGTIRAYRRDGDAPKVEVRDPWKGHRDLLPQYTDKNMHDVTAYLVTLK